MAITVSIERAADPLIGFRHNLALAREALLRGSWVINTVYEARNTSDSDELQSTVAAAYADIGSPFLR